MSRRVGIDRFVRALDKRLTRWLYSWLAIVVRRRVALGGGHWAASLPATVIRRFDLDGGAVDPIRIEIGGGQFPSPGYIHVDLDRHARHTEYIATAWDLPFPDESAAEILAIHVLEHIHPGLLHSTLSEWQRVLMPTGRIQIHVPNAPAMLRAFENVEPARKWALVSAFFGMYRDVNVSSPDELDPARDLPDHQALFDFPLLEDLLVANGFERVTDVTSTVVDRHSEGWKELLPHLSLVVQAFRPEDANV